MVIVDVIRCTGCGMCVSACPTAAITCFGIAHILDSCVDCGICIAFCPTEALSGSKAEAHGFEGI